MSHPIAAATSAVSANVPTALRILKDVAESLSHVPYVKTIAGVSVQILEIRDQVNSNKELCHELIDNVAARSVQLVNALQNVEAHGQLKTDLQDYERLLIKIHHRLLDLTPGHFHKLKAYMLRDEIKNKLQAYNGKLTDFDRSFNFTRLLNIELNVQKLVARGDPSTSAPVTVSRIPPPPPPSKLFTGREDVLAKMEECFKLSTTSVASRQQHVFVLYGMGGAGKTQIGLKFIQQYADQ